MDLLRLMLGPRTQVTHLVSQTNFLGTHPFVGHQVGARRMGNVLSGNALPHVEAQGASKRIVCFQASFLVTHPFRGSPGVRAPYRNRIEWLFFASCWGPERK